jgi:hypothetical protein
MLDFFLSKNRRKEVEKKERWMDGWMDGWIDR